MRAGRARMRKFWNLHAWQNHRAAVATAVAAGKYHTVPRQTIPTRQRLGCATQQYDPAAPKKDAAAARRNATHAPEAAPHIYAAARYGSGGLVVSTRTSSLPKTKVARRASIGATAAGRGGGCA